MDQEMSNMYIHVLLWEFGQLHLNLVKFLIRVLGQTFNW